jgi:hypothetical protein
MVGATSAVDVVSAAASEDAVTPGSNWMSFVSDGLLASE